MNELKREVTGRNMGIELLRIVSMLMVVLLHMLMPILSRTRTGGGVFELTWLLECACYCAVNCYGLISGYVGAGDRVSIGRAAGLWLQVEFYSLGLALVELAVNHGVSKDPILWSIFPITSGRYWYMTAYFGLMLLMPLLEAGVRSLSEGKLGALAFGVLILSASVTLYAPYSDMNIGTVSGIGAGYNVIWLALLYIVGGFLRRSGFVKRVKKRYAAALYLISLTLTWLGVTRGDWRYASYTSPTVLLEGVALTMIFAGLDIKGKIIKRAVGILAPAALGVYLVHINHWLYEALIGRFTLSFPKLGGPVCVLLVILTGGAVYLACTAVELLRLRLFKLLRVKELTDAIDGLTKKFRGGVL